MEVMQPYQKNLYKDILQGWEKGAILTVAAVGRQTGKSTFYQYAQEYQAIFKMPKFEIIDSALVDGEQWHTVRCAKEVSAWVRTMNEQQWCEHIDQRGYIDRNVFDMNERLYTMLGMKWS